MGQMRTTMIVDSDFDLIEFALHIKEKENLTYTEIANRTNGKVSVSTVRNFFDPERWDGVISTRRFDYGIAICKALEMTIKVEY